MVIASLDINKNQCLYVGDSDVDMIVSNNACIDNIAVSWGYRDIDLLKSYHPKFNISQFSDIIKIILK
jgi:phosphoglycolate phosphatase